MAINFTDFSKIAPQQPWYGTALEDALKGYQISQEPKKIAQEQKQRELANSLQELALKHKPKEYELADALKIAQTSRANRPAALKGALANAQSVRNSYPEGSREWKEADDYIKKLNTPKSGIQFNQSPEGGFSVSIGGEAQPQEAIVPGFGKLKTGEVPMYDTEGKPLAIGKPYTEGEKKELAGREFFNVVQPFVNKAQAYYSGKDSTKRFESDVINYSTDEAAKQRIDNLLAADKLLFAGVVKENATLGGANTNKVYDKLTKSLQNSEVYPLLKDIAKYQLPAGYTEQSGAIFNKILNEATEKGQNLPAYKPFYLKTNSDKNKEREAVFKKKLAQKKSFNSEAEAKAYYKSLTPEEKIEFKRLHAGGK